PAPSANISQAYTNPDGISRGGCTYCGFCARFGCMVGAKAQPSSLLLPIIQKRQNVSVRTGAWVRRILLVPAPKSAARGVSYVDAAGQEVFQPASLVFLASWTFNNTRLLLLSGIGEPYHPATGRGTLGSNLTHQVTVPSATAGFAGEHLAYKTNLMDLDPVYKDALGDPLLRLTMDWRDNERKMVGFATPIAVDLARAMGARQINPFPGLGSYDATRYNSTHVQGRSEEHTSEL